MTEHSRRTVLRGIGAAGAAGLAGLGGCLMPGAYDRPTDDREGVLPRDEYGNPAEADFSDYAAVEARVEDLRVSGGEYGGVDVITVATADPQGTGVRTLARPDVELMGDGYDYHKREVREHELGSPAGDDAVTGLEIGDTTPITDLWYDDGIDEETVFRLRGPVAIMATDPDRESLEYVLDIERAEPDATVPDSWYPDA